MLIRLKPEQIIGWTAAHFKYKPSGSKQIRICNPRDPKDRGYNLWISLVPAIPKSGRTKREDFWVHDFRPNHQQCDGSFLNFVAKYRNITFRQAIKEVCGITVDLKTLLRDRDGKQEEPEEHRDLISLPEGSMKFGEEDPLEELAMRYLRSRRITRDEAIKHGLCFTINSLIFPYYEFGDLVYWQSRSLMDKSFLFPENTDKSNYLFGFDFCEPDGEVIITESAVSAILLGDGVVASGGASLNDLALKKLKLLHPERIVLAPDNDVAGLDSLRKNFKVLNHGFSGRIWQCLPPKEFGKDWGEWAEKGGKDQLRPYLEANKRKMTIADLVKSVDWRPRNRDSSKDTWNGSRRGFR